MLTHLLSHDTLMTVFRGGRSSRHSCPTAYYLALFVLLVGAQSGLASDLAAAHGTVAVDAYNGIAATADRSGLVRLFDVAAPDHPVLLSSFPLPGNLSGIALAGDSLLVAAQGGVQILDISDPSAPRFRNSVRTSAEVSVVKSAGNLGYFAYDDTVALFDIQTGEILDRRSYSGLAVNDMTVSAASLYILSSCADSATGLELIKVAVQGALGPPLASWKSAETATSSTDRLALYAADNFVYIGSAAGAGASQTPHLEIVQDLGTSFRIAGPSPAGDAGPVRPMGVNFLAYTAAANPGEQNNRIGVLDVSDPSQTEKLLGAAGTSGPAYDVTLYEGYVYVAAGDAGLQVVKFEAPNGSHQLPTITLGSSNISEAPQPGTLLRLTAQVTAGDQVRKVDFYLNGQRVATDGSYPFEYRAFESDVDAAGSLVVSACAVDIDGNSSCTAPEDLSAGSGKSALSVISVTPTAGAHVSHASRMSLMAQFSHALDPASVTTGSVSLVAVSKAGSNAVPVALAAVSYQPGSKSVVIQPRSALSTGTYRATLSSGIRGASGNTLAQGYSWIFNVTPTTVTWTSPVSGNWSTGANWSGGAVPANGDNVVINETPGVTVTLNSGSPQVENLTVGATNTLLISGGALAVVGTGSVATLNLASGSIGGPGTVTVTSAMDWTNGGITGPLVIPAKATLQVNTPAIGNCNSSTFYLAGGTINNSGTVTQTFAGSIGGNCNKGFEVSLGGVINNLAGGVWNIAGNVWVYPTDSSATAFNNTGTLNKTEGTGTSSWSLALSGAGPINIQNGTFNLGGSYPTSKLAGPISIASGTTLGYGAGGVLDGGKVTGAGTLNFNAATTVTGAYSFAGITQIQSGSGVAITFQNPTSITTLNLISGVLAGPGPVTIGTMDWTNGGITGPLVIPAKATLQVNTPAIGNCNSSTFYLAGGTINNSGTVTQTFAGSIGGNCNKGFEISQGGVINNLAGGVWNIAGNVWVYPTDSSATAFNNTGTLNKTEGTGTSSWSLALSGAGPINIQNGTFNLGGSYPNSKLAGPISIASGTTLGYGAGGVLDGGKVTGAGTLNFNAATTVTGAYSFAGITQIQSGSGVAITFQNPTTITTLNLISGVLAGPGPVTIGTMDWTNGGITGTLVIPAKATLQVNTPAIRQLQ